MPHTNFIANGRIVFDDFRERFYFFVSIFSDITFKGRLTGAHFLPLTDREFAKQVFEFFMFERPAPTGFSSDPVELPKFRIIRLIDEEFNIVPPEVQDSLKQSGESSRAVTILGHIANETELGSHDQRTNPTIVIEKLATNEDIQQRAYDLSLANPNSPLDNWLRAERELLGLH